MRPAMVPEPRRGEWDQEPGAPLARPGRFENETLKLLDVN